MAYKIDADKCVNCGACESDCPVSAISENGDKRTISITNLKTSNSVTGKSKELVEALQNAAYYKGDKNYLKIAPEAKNSYVQLGHYK